MPQDDETTARHADASADPAPQPEADQQGRLDHIREVSQNARTTWFGLLGLLAFVGVTLLGHADADFFAFGAQTQLPLIDVRIPVKSFFIVAPALVAALYIYLHLYLMTLWDALGDLEQREDAPPVADRVFPWLMSHAALWYRNRVRADGSAAPRTLGWAVIAVSMLFGWVFGLVVLAGLWVRSMPAHDEWLTLWIGLCFWAATLVGVTGFMAARARMRGRSREYVAGTATGRGRLAAGLTAILAFLSWETTEGSGAITMTESGRPALLYPADLAESELTRKPDDWLPWRLWMEEFEANFRRREGIAPGTDFASEAEAAFQREARQRYSENIAQLDAPDLQGADLRYANLNWAFLPGADLRNADLAETSLYAALLQGVNFNGAQLDNAYLRGAKIQMSNFSGAQMKGANFRSAQMQQINTGCDVAIVISGSVAYRERCTSFLLAILADANMTDSDISYAIMHGSVLQGTQLQGTDCRYTDFRGAFVGGANLKCDGLSEKQLENAVGTEKTILPDGISVPSCWKNPPETFDQFIEIVEEKPGIGTNIRWLCHAGGRTGTPFQNPKPN